MADHRDDRSFRLDRNARSFAPSDFGFGDVPWIVIALAVILGVIAGLSYLVDQLGRLVPPGLRLAAIGFVLGFLSGLQVSAWTARRSQARTPGRDDSTA